jgi:hypothetical protein
MSKFVSIAMGAGQMVTGAFLLATGNPMGAMLLAAGAGGVISGIGTLMSKGPVGGVRTTLSTSTAPWETCYGRCHSSGFMAFANFWPPPSLGANLGGGNNQMLDLVIVLAAHPCQSVDALLFDQQRVQIDCTTGTCDTSGTAVTWTGGTEEFNKGGVFGGGGFAAGQLIQINGKNYAIASWNSATSLTLTVSAGTQTNVPYLGGGSCPPGAPPGSGTSFTPLQRTVKYTGSNPTRIQRNANGVVTVTLSNNIPYLVEGDRIQLSNVPGDLTLNGTFLVNEIISQVVGSPGSITFTFLSGGPSSDVVNAGWVTTLWADYGASVYFEPILGNQVLGQTFAGMTEGTPLDGNETVYVLPENPVALANTFSFGNQPTAAPNPWTADCSLQGKTAVFLRFHYSQQFYPAQLPTISFLFHGKNNILDPRLSGSTTWATAVLGSIVTGSGVYTVNSVLGQLPALPFQVTIGVPSLNQTFTVTGITGTSWSLTFNAGQGAPDTFGVGVAVTVTGPGNIGYTENAVLCIADFYATPETQGGYGGTYGTDIPLDDLIAAANTCDEQVPLSISQSSPPQTEPLWACNGKFTLATKRGEILQNLLTSCAGRVTTTANRFVIWPGAWIGNSFAIGSDPGGGVTALGNFSQLAAGGIKWRGISGRDLYNGVKGTYISQANKYMATDFPPYCQDDLHGYGPGGLTPAGSAAYDYDANLEADGGDRLWLDIQLPFTVSHRQAQQTAKIELLRRRQFQTATFVFNMMAYQIAEMDLGLMTVPALGWGTGSPPSPVQVEVQETRLHIEDGKDGDGPALLMEVDVQTTSTDIYEWDTLEELSPSGYMEPVIPGVGPWQFFATETIPGFTASYPWNPGQVSPLVGDAYFLGPVGGSPLEYLGPATFGLDLQYDTDEMGNATSAMNLIGILPSNVLSQITAPPQIKCVPGISGNLPPGTYVVAASAADSGSPPETTRLGTPVYVTIPVQSPPDNNGSIEVTVSWPGGSPGGSIWLAKATPAAGWNQQTFLASTSSTYTITDVFGSTGAPDSTLDHLAAACKKVIHEGRWAQQVQAVTATTVTIAGAGHTLNLWAGGVLTLLGKLDSTQQLIVLNMPVASSTASAGSPPEFVLTIGTNAAGHQLPDLTTLLEIGDVVAMNLDATFTPTSFSDPLIANPYYPGGATGIEAGNVAVVLTGPDAGDVQLIGSVALDGSGHPTIFELAGKWNITPNAGDQVIVCEASYGPEYHSSFAASAGTEPFSTVTVPFTNKGGQTWLFIVRAQTSDDINGLDRYAPIRAVYIFGAQGTRTIYGYAVVAMLVTDRIIQIDATNGNVTLTLAQFALIPNQGVYINRIDDSANTVTVDCFAGDTIGGQASFNLTQNKPLVFFVPGTSS